MERVRTFAIQSPFVLQLEDVYSELLVHAGDNDGVRVVMTGDEELIDGVTLSDDEIGALLIKETGDSLGTADVVIGNNSVVVRGNVRGSLSISGNGVFINGQRVTADMSNAHVVKEPLKIEVFVPSGTDLEIDGCGQLVADGQYGRLRASIGGQDQVDVSQATTVSSLRTGGQSRLRIRAVADTDGQIRLTSGGQSSIDIAGSFGALEVESGGQSRIQITGDCASFEGHSSGQSTITRTGRVSGRCREKSSGQSRILSPAL